MERKWPKMTWNGLKWPKMTFLTQKHLFWPKNLNFPRKIQHSFKTTFHAKTFDGTIRVRGLPLKDGTEAILRELFVELKIRKIMCPTQMNSERSCGEAFIQFKTFTDALAALEKNSHTLDGGYELEVNESCNNEFRPRVFQKYCGKSQFWAKSVLFFVGKSFLASESRF